MHTRHSVIRALEDTQKQRMASSALSESNLAIEL